MSEPLECGYCESRTRVLPHPKLSRYSVFCLGCGVIGPSRLTEADAVAAWNSPILEREKLKARIAVMESKARVVCELMFPEDGPAEMRGIPRRWLDAGLELQNELEDKL